MAAARVSAEVLRVALSRAPQSALTNALGGMLTDFSAACIRVGKATGSSHRHTGVFS